jgi:hypothetical protein
VLIGEATAPGRQIPDPRWRVVGVKGFEPLASAV